MAGCHIHAIGGGYATFSGEQNKICGRESGSACPGTHYTSEVAAAYAHRADTPSQLWSGMLDRVRTNLDLLGYAMLFFPEQHPLLAQILKDKCANGLRVRISLADPDSAEVMARDELEGLSGTLPGRILSTVRHFEPLFSDAGVEIRYHSVPLYNALYRFDDQIDRKSVV